jgi:hypothetical protein
MSRGVSESHSKDREDDLLLYDANTAPGGKHIWRFLLGSRDEPMVAFSSLFLIPTPVRDRLLAPKRMILAYECT